MWRAMLAGAAVLVLDSPVEAQQWIPPQPGQDTCSGWSDAAHRAACVAGEAESHSRDDARRLAEQAQVKAIQDAEAARIKAARESAEAARQRNAADAAEQAKDQAAADAEASARAEARTRSFDFGADEFGRLLAQIAATRGRPLSARVLDCSQPAPDREGACDYETPLGVEMSVTSRPGTFRAALITVTWDGTSRAMLPFAWRVTLICRALAPADQERAAIEQASGLLGSIDRPGAWGEKRWTSGHVGYVIRPDPKLGARGSVVFTAEDLGD